MGADPPLGPSPGARDSATQRRSAVHGEDGTLVTAGGRVPGVTATGPSLAAARQKAHTKVARIHFEGAHYRRDIGLEDSS